MTTTKTAIKNTIKYLRRCQRARAAGYPVSFTTDPAWLVEQAINRRAGWPDDPSSTRGSAMPTHDGRYPTKASGDKYAHIRRLACALNTPRLIVREGELGEWRRLILERVPQRISRPEDL
jgi:hypothetical protein